MSGVRYNDPKVFDVRKRSSSRKPRKPKVPLATKEYVQRALTADKELNWVMIDTSAQNIGYDAPLLAHWSPIAQGDTISQRNGDRITVKALKMNYKMLFPAGVNASARIIIFQWKPDNVIDAPTMAKILSNASTDYSIHSPLVETKVLRSKFHVLSDKIFNNLNSVTGSTYCRSMTIRKFNGKFINFSAGSTNGKNQIYILAFSDQLIASATCPNFKKVVHLNWKDTA